MRKSHQPFQLLKQEEPLAVGPKNSENQERQLLDKKQNHISQSLNTLENVHQMNSVGAQMTIK